MEGRCDNRTIELLLRNFQYYEIKGMLINVLEINFECIVNNFYSCYCLLVSVVFGFIKWYLFGHYFLF